MTSIGEYAFYGCYFLKDAFINNSTLTSDNNWGAILCDEKTSDGLMIDNNVVIAYRGKEASVNIPEGVTSIANSVFFGCGNLTSVTIPSSMTSIGEAAFSSCSNLEEILCYAVETPEILGTRGRANSFYDVPVSTVRLYVPDDAIENYKAHAIWGKFKIETITGIKEIENENGMPEYSGEERYDLSGHRIDKPTKGINIIRYSDGTSKKVLIK